MYSEVEQRGERRKGRGERGMRGMEHGLSYKLGSSNDLQSNELVLS